MRITHRSDAIPCHFGPGMLVAALLVMIMRPAHPSTTPAQASPGAGQTIRVDVTLVTVPVAVAARDGKYLGGLTQSDFRIFENGVEQKIDRLVPGTDPFHVALMIDTSGSTHFKISEMQNAALAFVEALRPQDRIMAISFDSRISFDCEFTEDREQLRRAILQTQGTGDNTRLYDALQRVVKEKLNPVSGRKAIVLFTDGMDNASENADAADTRALVEQSNVLVYAIQYDTRKDPVAGQPNWGVIPRPQGYPTLDDLYDSAVRYLKDVTGRSGGRLYHAETAAGLSDAFSQIADDLRHQYTLCYYPADQRRDGSYRSIRVKIDKPGVRVRARSGYRTVSSPRIR